MDITDNLLLENSEQFQVRLSDPLNTSIGVGTNTVTITDDDVAAVGFAATAISVAEDTNSVTIYVLRTGTTNTTVSVNYTTLTNGSATVNSDFRATNGVLSYAPGVVTNSFTLTVLNDATAENNETINLRLSSPTNISLGTSNLVVTVTTNDSAILSFSVATNLVSETNGTLTLTVNRTGTTNNAVTVDFTTTNITASAGSDYIATNGTLSFAAGETSKTFTTDLIDDDIQENTETLRIVLSNPVDATITTGTNTVTISDDDVSTVGFTAGTTAAAETNGTVTFTVVRSGATNTTVTLDFTTTNATALAGSDYTATNGTFTFSPGETTNTLTIEIADNATQESPETFQVRLSNVLNSSLAIGTNIVTITDDDISMVSYTTNSIVVEENTNTVTLTVVRSGATNTTVSVNFTNLPSPTSTATAGSDFMATNGLLTFAPGVTTNTFTVTVIDDAAAENREFIAYRLQTPSNTSLGTSNLVITINTNDSAILSWSAASTTIAEDGGTLTLTVNRSGTTFNAVTVDFTSTNVTAVDGSDYTGTNGTLSFAAGETSKTITVDLTEDDLQEGNETFRLVLSGPVDATIGTGTNTVTITDNDGSTIAFTTNAVTLAETNVSVTLTVVRSGATNTAVSVNFTTTNVTASAGSDYTTTNGTFSFAPGETTNTLTIELADDLLYEGNESFRVILSGISNSSLGTGTNTVTITDDDVAYLGFSAATDSVNELDGSIDITVERSGVTNTTVSVAYQTANVSATAGADYTAASGVLSFAPGETNKSITIAVAFDADIELNETFRVRLLNLTNAAAGTFTTNTITITDAFGDPPAAPAISISSFTAIGGRELLLRITGPNGSPVVIETTTDFKVWAPVHSATITSGGFDWIAPIDPAEPARFFRVAPPH